MTKQQPDSGYTLIELLLVIVVLALLATVVVVSTRGFTSDAQDASCAEDAKILESAAVVFMGRSSVDEIPAASPTPDGYEDTLVNHQLLRRRSVYYDLDAHGNVLPAVNSPCTT
jgi:prepilin-type N-terminal cleavage/methylation domain-containing protein